MLTELTTRVPVAGRKSWKVLVPAAVILVAAATVGTIYFRSRQTATRLTDKNTIILSDFNNRTGASVFDDTLKQGALGTPGAITLSRPGFRAQGE